MDEVYNKILNSMPSAQKKNVMTGRRSAGSMSITNKTVGGKKMTSKMVGSY